MKKKVLLFITLGLALITAIPALTGCSGLVAAQDSTPQIQISQQAQGIWVTGSGEVTVTPDIAILRLGIVAQDATVAAARVKASDAMTKVMKALTDSGIAQKDVQTGYFSIDQRTRWDDDRQVETIIGYQVSNMVTVKVRDIDKVGSIIDSIVQVGGDFTRMSDISFSVEDPTSYYQQAREKAMADARKKAEQLANLAGVTLGKPTYVVEGAQYSPIYGGNRGMMDMAIPAAESTTPISAGETKIVLDVQVAYSIL